MTENPSAQPQGNAVPPKKKSNTVIWIVGGCGAFVLIGGIIFALVMWWGYHKAKTYVKNAVEERTGSMNKKTQLWTDVPPMQGMTGSQQAEMPLAVKAVAGPFLDAMMRGMNNGKDAGHWDVAFFSVPGKTTKDVESFYDSKRMSGFGWDAQGGCSNTSSMTFCSFQKQQSGKTTGLLVIAADDTENKATTLYFVRQEAQEGATNVSAGSGQVPTDPVAAISLNQDLTSIDVCSAIPKSDVEAILGRPLVKSPSHFEYYDTKGSSGCSYDAGKSSSGEAFFGYVAFTPVQAYSNQPLNQKMDVSGLGQQAYFNNGADARQLWIKVNDQAAMVVAFGDIAREDGARALARLVLDAIH